jgi:hypothetical protein
LSLFIIIIANMDEFMEVSSDDDSLERRSAATNLSIQAAGLLAMLEGKLMVGDGTDNKKKKQVTKRQFTTNRRSFDHLGAYNNIQRDHLGTDSLFGKEFPMFFRITRSRVELIIQRLGNSDDSFYTSFRTNKYGLVGPSL